MKLKIPVTATHINKETGEFLRWGKSIYAECLVSGYWVECGTLKNYELPPDGYMPVSYKYELLDTRKSRFSAKLCNLRLALIKSQYRLS